MNQYLTLLKTLLKQKYRFERINPTGKKNRGWIALVIVGISCLPLAVMLFIGVISLGQIASNLDIVPETLTYIITMQQVVVLFFGIGGMLGTIYFSKDAEFLLSMPLKPSAIYAVKLTCVYIYELITSVGLAIITLLPFGIGASMPFWYYIQMLLVTLILPMLPLLLCSIIAIPLMWFVSFFKNKGIITSFVYVIIFGLAFGGYYYLIGLISVNGDAIFGEEMITALLNSIKAGAKFIFPNYLLASSLCADTFARYLVNFLLAILINAVLFFIAVAISSLVYRRSISKQLENSTTTLKVKDSKVTHGKLYTIFSTDIKRLMRDSNMGMYCLLQVVLIPIVAAFMLSQFSQGSSQGIDPTTMSIINTIMPVFMVAFMGFMSYSCNYAATGAFTREGQSFYLYKTFPIDFRLIVKSKVIIGVLFNEATFLITVIICAVMTNLVWYYAIMMFLVLTLFGTATVWLQVIIDLKKPRLKWNTFAEGAKNNPASLWSLLIGFVSMVVVGGIGTAFLVPQIMYGLTWTTLTMWLTFILVGAIYLLISVKVANRHSEEYFANIE